MMRRAAGYKSIDNGSHKSFGHPITHANFYCHFIPILIIAIIIVIIILVLGAYNVINIPGISSGSSTHSSSVGESMPGDPMAVFLYNSTLQNLQQVLWVNYGLNVTVS